MKKLPKKLIIAFMIFNCLGQPLTALASHVVDESETTIESTENPADSDSAVEEEVSPTLPEIELPPEDLQPESPGEISPPIEESEPEVTPQPPEKVPEVNPKPELLKPVEEVPSNPIVSESINQGQPAIDFQVSGGADLIDELAITSGSMAFTKNQSTEQFILRLAKEARKVGQEKNIYASVMIAQAILESASGNSQLASAPNYNLFGIKGSYQGHSVGMATEEDNGSGSLYTITANFKKYPSYKESLEDYGDLITKGIDGNSDFYKGTWKSDAKTYQEATQFLTGRYATDVKYNQKLNGLIETYQLVKYDQAEIELTDEVSLLAEKVTTEALSFLGVPYVWGGTTPTPGFDCSGLVQYVFDKSLNVDLPRVTTQQEFVGEEVALDSLLPGDLLFFGARGGTHHVALYLGDNQFVHAPETGDVVKVTAMTDFMPDFAKRVLGN